MGDFPILATDVAGRPRFLLARRPSGYPGNLWLGTLTTTPVSDGDKQYGARVRCDKKLTTYLSVEKIRAVPLLNDISIVRAPQGSNFMLSREAARAIAELIEPEAKPLIPPIPAELVDSIRSGGCVLFAGAGLSARAGVPTWNQFLNDLLTFASGQQIIDPSDAASLSAALKEGARNAAADGLVHAFGSRREMLEGFLQNTFPQKQSLLRFHDLLAQIPFAAVVTTNYDDLLEESFPEFTTAVIATLTDRADIEFLRVTENYRVFVKLAEAPQGVPLELLSQGLTSLLGWAGYLCQRLKETAQESSTDPIPTNAFALVLVDELDAHMHPRWQQVLVGRLKQVFPNVHFIASTHSPLIVGGLDTPEVDRFVVQNGKVSVLDVAQEATVGRTDQILTSPLFGLTSARGQRSGELLDRYADLAAKDELTADEEKEFTDLARVLRVAVPTDEEQATANQVFNLIQSALEGKLGEMNEGDREKIMRELKVRSKEIATGSARDL